jgi:hypothetical protein
MDEDQELALGTSVVLLVICVSCLSWGLHHVLTRNRITEEPSEEQYASLLVPASTASSHRGWSS